MIGLISQNKTVTFQEQHGVTDYDIDGLSEEGSFYYHQILEFSKEMKSVEVILNELWISIFSSFVSRFLVLILLLLGRIHLPFNKTLTDDTSSEWAINKTFLFFIRF